ncbi:hypothetical protein B5F77_04920 [Parabacteroides sp. An277]|uniref:hypothetical protein n=1 Tax=Parabacteroides sp. An277 TaxID=1965619 RepID=UPI000B3A36AA|nr:hypothetical protein [Parabacteroides sp. An277]OUO53942.1 hypothetical protein B5F77_04920 [Parabacteroides sp. An277]
MVKKVMGVIGVVAVCAVAGWNYQQSSKDLKKLFVENIGFSDIEAIAMCEVTNKKGEVLLKCDGGSTCSTTKFGHTLTCDGTKVAL